MTDSNPDFTTEDREFRQQLFEAADKLDEPSRDLKRRLLDRLVPQAKRRSPGWFLAVAAIFALLAGGTALKVLESRARSAAPSVRPEPVTQPVRGPCAHAYHAEGLHPLIDDFEDEDSRSATAEGRGTPWLLHFDFDDKEKGAQRFLRPESRPEPRSRNRFALHLAGPELRDWGAVAQLPLGALACYDAGAYAGIEFWARGPGRLFAGAQSVGTTPIKWGGTCEKDCYKQHVGRVELEPRWKHYSLRWEQMRQRGYATTPLDPTELNSIVFAIQGVDTPFDLWLDDIAFIEGPPSPG